MIKKVFSTGYPSDEPSAVTNNNNNNTPYQDAGNLNTVTNDSINNQQHQQQQHYPHPTFPIQNENHSHTATATATANAPLLPTSTVTATNQNNKNNNVTYGLTDNNTVVGSLPLTNSGGGTTTASRPHLNDLVEKEEISDRNAFDFDHYDVEGDHTIEEMLEPRTDSQLQLQSLLSIVTLLNSVATIMVLVASFKHNTSSDIIMEQFGYNNFQNIVNVLQYAPLLFLLLFIWIINNYFSCSVFYEYLRRGLLTDFPNSSETKYIITHFQPLIFIIFFVVYILFAVVVMFIAETSLGVIVTFCSNLIVGVVITFYKNQNIENRLVSLPDFIISFPDKKSYKNASISKEQREEDLVNTKIDECNLKFATSYLRNVTLLSTDSPSYCSSMREKIWRMKNVSDFRQKVYLFAVWLSMFAIVGLCVLYFQILGEKQIDLIWQTEFNPCVMSCANVSYSINNNNNQNNLTASLCSQCLCSCGINYKKMDESYTSRCVTQFRIPTVCAAQTTVDALCSALTGGCVGYV